MKAGCGQRERREGVETVRRESVLSGDAAEQVLICSGMLTILTDHLSAWGRGGAVILYKKPRTHTYTKMLTNAAKPALFLSLFSYTQG